MKRFVAGAQCPECGSKDTLYFESGDDYESVHCTRCSYHAKRSDQEASSGEQPEEHQNIKWH